MADETLRLFREAGFANAELQEVPTGYPPVYGEIPGPDGAPTVMLYAHYDVQPAPLEQGWTSDPWTATPKPDPSEIERMILAQAFLLQRLAGGR